MVLEPLRDVTCLPACSEQIAPEMDTGAQTAAWGEVIQGVDGGRCACL